MQCESEVECSLPSPEKPPEAELRFKHFKYLSSVVSEKQKEPASSHTHTPNRSPQLEQLEAYNDQSMYDEDVDALNLWVQNQQKYSILYPDLALVAFDLLVVPASSIPIGSVFNSWNCYSWKTIPPECKMS